MEKRYAIVWLVCILVLSVLTGIGGAKLTRFLWGHNAGWFLGVLMFFDGLLTMGLCNAAGKNES